MSIDCIFCVLDLILILQKHDGGHEEDALLASSDSGGSAYPPSSSSAVSPSNISIQDVQPLPQPATAVPVYTPYHPRMLSTRNQSYDVDSEVILKPPKNKSYKPNEIKLLGKRFRKVDLRGALIGTGYDTRQKLLYRNLEGVNIIYSSLPHEEQLEVDALVEYDPLAVNQACGIAQSSGNGGEMVIVVVRYQKYTK